LRASSFGPLGKTLELFSYPEMKATAISVDS
jgi:hypothetical protein